MAKKTPKQEETTAVADETYTPRTVWPMIGSTPIGNAASVATGALMDITKDGSMVVSVRNHSGGMRTFVLPAGTYIYEV